MRHLLVVATLALLAMGIGATPANALVGLNTSIVSASQTMNGTTDINFDVSVTCPSDTVVTGGGFYSSGLIFTGGNRLNVQRSWPDSTTSWHVTGFLDNTYSGAVTVYAVCAKVA